ncbi:MAG: hypothetical protein APR54_03145 [Candidatus Cloacimonas sp. SDB]|nr:MAG: hypothetical protein APR54_03145 [Candidatus Cloacimonas sp. SDB]
MLKKIVNCYDGLSIGIQVFISAIGVAIPFYFAAYLSYSVSEIGKQGDTKAFLFHAVIFIILLIMIFFISRYLTTIRESLHKERSDRQAALLHAYTNVDRLVVSKLVNINNGNINENKFVETFVTSIKDIQNLVEATFNTFETAFGQSSTIEARVDFEVTFMTKSYLDGEITIPACANREGRAPRSMIHRTTNHKIYENSITATIYREPRPSMHIIEDTNSGKVSYQELYPGETKRIKSSIVFPVLSNANELLGTLVVHCDKSSFFKCENEKYWHDLLEIFSKRMALHKMQMDAIMNYISKSGVELKILIPNFNF